MLDIVQRYVSEFGICATLVALCSGCATGTPSRNDSAAQLNRQQLNEFLIDCKLRNQQIAFLLGQWRSADDKLLSFRPDEGKQINWIIQSHVIYLRNYC